MQKLPIPEIGSVLDGYLFKGGDPNDPKSWESVSDEEPVIQQSARPMPKIGDEVDGYVYKGGDPNSQDAWVKDAGLIAGLGKSFVEGSKDLGRRAGATLDLLTGDNAGVEQAREKQMMAEANKPAQLQALKADFEARKKALGEDASALDQAGSALGAAGNNLIGTSQLIAESAPNSVLSLGAGYAGAKIGAAGGAVLGPVGAVVGGGIGFLGGMFLGNFLGEAGGSGIEKAEGGLTDAESSEALTEGGIKSGVITAVDAVTLGAGKIVSKQLGKAAIEAGARAEAKVLSQAGVDVTDVAQIGAALADPAIKKAAQEAGEKAFQATSTLGSRAAQAGTVLSLETFGEGSGEYLGNLAATGDANVFDAVVESIAGLTQSTPEAVYNIARANAEVSSPKRIADVSRITQAETASDAIDAALATSTLELETPKLADLISQYRSNAIDLAEADPTSLAAPATEQNGLVTLGAAEGLQVADTTIPESGSQIGQAGDLGFEPAANELVTRLASDIRASGEITSTQEQFLRGTGNTPLLQTLQAEMLQGQKRPDINQADVQLDEVSAFVNTMARENTPAARAFTAEFNAGNITTDDVRASLFQQRRGGDEVQSRITAATEGRAPSAQAGVQSADVMTPMARTPALQEAVRMYGNLPLTQADQRENFTTRLGDAASQAAPVVPSAVDQASVAIEAAANQAPMQTGTAVDQSFSSPTVDAATDSIQAAAQEGQKLKESKGTGKIITLNSAPRGEVGQVRELPGGVTFKYVDESSLGITSKVEYNDKGAVANATMTKLQYKVISTLLSPFGKRIQLYESDTAGDGFVLRDEDRKTIFLNTKGTINPLQVAMHELLHILRVENPDAYRILARVILNRKKLSLADRTGFANYYRGEPRRDSEGNVIRNAAGEIQYKFDAEELVADTFGTVMSDPQMWTEVFSEIQAEFGSTKAQQIVAKMVASINKVISALLKTFKNGNFTTVGNFVGKTEEELLAVRAAVRQAAVAYAKQQRMSPMAMEGKIIQAERQVNLGGQTEDTAENADPIGDNLENIRGLPVAQFSPERDNVRPNGESNGSGRNGSVQQVARSNRRAADEDTGVPQYGTAREGAVSVLGYHFSREPRQSLTGEKYGAGIKGAERKRLDNTSDNRLLKRVHFYADSGKGIRPEIGVGNSVHAVQLNNIYDPMVARLVPYNGNLNDWESAILDAGFDGYMLDFDDQKAVVLLGPKHSAVPVQLTQEFPKRQPIKQSRKRYQEAFDLARSKKWKNQREFKLALQEGVEPATDSELATELVSDAKFALQSNSNAVGWYNNTVTKALKVLSTLHPEIATDPNKRFAFVWALAVTSNGLKVDKNFELANVAYEQFKKNGRMPNNVGIGNASSAINEGLEMYNTLTAELGVDAARKFMVTEFKVNEIERITGMSVGGEFKETAVRGAAILGPKIGNGFYANLNKLFDQLTMDRWLMRTWGRLTGTLVTPNEANIATGRDRTAKAIKAVSKLKTAKAAFDELLKFDISTASIEQVAEAIKKASMKPDNRAKMNKTIAGQELRKAGNSLAGNLDAQKEAPSGPGERNQIRAVFADTLRQLQQEPDTKDLNMSDLQALLWYAEKRLYDTAGTADETSEGYEDDEAPDYANAAIKLAMANGVSRATIDQTIGVQSGNSTAAARQGSQPTTAAGQTQAQSQGAGGFDGRERAQFVRRSIINRFRRSNRAGNEESSRAYKRSSGGNGKGLRVLGQPSVAVFSPEARFKNTLQVAGRSAPKIYETRDAEGFFNSITESKQNSKFGASVHVYSPGEYGDMRLFMTQNGEAGFALKDDGDIVSVFGSPAFPGAVDAMLQLAIQEGGKKLDAFHTVLPELYNPHGFKVVSRTAWNDDFAPDGWDKNVFSAFNGGSPDVVFMVYDPDYFGAYERGSIPFSQSYDAAVAAQAAAVSEVEQREQAQPEQTRDTVVPETPKQSKPRGIQLSPERFNEVTADDPNSQFWRYVDGLRRGVVPGIRRGDYVSLFGRYRNGGGEIVGNYVSTRPTGLEALQFNDPLFGSQSFFSVGKKTKPENGSSGYAFFFIPEEFADTDWQSNPAPYSALMVTATQDQFNADRYVIGVASADPSTPAGQLLDSRGMLKPTGQFSSSGQEYFKTEMGTGATMGVLSEAARRLSLAIRRTPDQITWTRDTGSNPTSVRTTIDSEKIQAKFSRIRSPIGFYNKLDEAVEKAPKFLKTGDQWAQWVTGGKLRELGVKKEEIEWSGLVDYLQLKGKESVTLEDVQAYVQSNGVQVVETNLREAEDLELASQRMAEPYGIQVEMTGEEMEFYNEDGDFLDFDELPEQLQRQLESIQDSEIAKYAGYKTPGGTNYREVLLRLPSLVQVKKREMYSLFDDDNEIVAQGVWPPSTRSQELIDENPSWRVERFMQADATDAKINNLYRSNHWEQLNVLAHVRLQDFTDSTGAKVLFVDEVQSDFQQDFRKQQKKISAIVDKDFQAIVDRMKASGVLEVNCD